MSKVKLPKANVDQGFLFPSDVTGQRQRDGSPLEEVAPGAYYRAAEMSGPLAVTAESQPKRPEDSPRMKMLRAEQSALIKFDKLDKNRRQQDRVNRWAFNARTLSETAECDQELVRLTQSASEMSATAQRDVGRMVGIKVVVQKDESEGAVSFEAHTQDPEQQTDFDRHYAEFFREYGEHDANFRRDRRLESMKADFAAEETAMYAAQAMGAPHQPAA